MAALRHAVLTYHDPDALELLARIPNAFSREDCCRFPGMVNVYESDSVFLPAIIIARLWQDSELDHEHAAAEHPLAYVRAMGRAGDSSQIGRLIDIITEATDVDLISMCASVAGRLRSESAVRVLDRRIKQLSSLDQCGDLGE